MTDPLEPGRIDLGALDLGENGGRGERAIAEVMARIRAVGRPDVLSEIARHARGFSVAAALVIAIASALLRGRAVPERESPEVATIAAWALDDHVPTNGELLATFHGYGR